MKLLIITQIVDSQDSSLGFFHSWIEKMAMYFESVEVICLYEGVHSLPNNVRVHSLGKEKSGASKFKYAIRFLHLMWHLRSTYDSVFIHMNQEYVLLGGPFWVVLKKKVYLWRNHYAGSFLTRIAGMFCTNVFCTSTHSYTTRFKNTILMPVGVDLSLFTQQHTEKRPDSILFLGRMTPSKKPDLLLEALVLLSERDIPFTATFCGPTLPEHAVYVEELKQKVRTSSLKNRVTFLDGVPHEQTASIYASHDIYVNLATSGMFDKTLFEACSSECLVLATSDDFQKRLGTYATPMEETPSGFAKRLEYLLTLPPAEKAHIRAEQMAMAEREDLATLIKKVSSVILA